MSTGLNQLELFSGIGGFRQAVEYIARDFNISCSTVAYSEIDAKADITYRSNFSTENIMALGDITKFSKKKEILRSIPDFNLLTGGFPCQTFSMMGAQAGFRDDRGKMFFYIMDIVSERYPKYLLFENVKNLTRHNSGKTFDTILKKITDAGYYVHYDVFNSRDYCLPQNRSRVIIFARQKPFGDFLFSEERVRECFEQIRSGSSSISVYTSVIDILEKKVAPKYYLSERIKPTILSDGSAGFRSLSDIDQIIARPLCATMHKMHRACQDNYYSDDFISSDGKIRPSATLSKSRLARLNIRKLTPREAFMLQGFPENFAANASSVADGSLYSQAGNAVSVNVIYAVLAYLISNRIIL